MTWKSRSVLITGAMHFAGAHLARELVRLGSYVRVLVEQDYYNSCGSLDSLPLHLKSQIEVIRGNLASSDIADQAVNGIDVVFHLGALDMVSSCIDVRDYIQKAMIGTLNVLNAAKRYAVQRLVHVSGAKVYGEAEHPPINEEHYLTAQSPYIGIKIGAEKLVEGHHMLHGLPVSIVRIFNVYGPIQPKTAIVPIIIVQALKDTEVLLGDMRAVRDFVYVDDVIEGIVKMAEAPEAVGEVVHFGSGRGTSIESLSEKILSLIGRDIEIVFDATRIRIQEPDIMWSVADIAKAKKILGWQPKTSLDLGLERTIEWFAERIDCLTEARCLLTNRSI